ncbi:DUF305 domain-containing protein [Phycicoccus sp. Soil748]|uniref:DUF305 domain-containing protein n=1 Tax=Phycicoccus sp. Soil748 TaxID=1736397 RepID=UPI000702E843|nr:DUF305 domain-containing protein [Phycicoccus sp. Soil748]KRE52974.1 hypothetical protein ASG70_13480 [Phycicoccus sp. Soil748]
MRRTSRILIVTASLAAALTVGACSADGGHGGMSAMTGMGSTPTGSRSSGAASDVMFAQMMVPHHQQAIEMADVAESKAQSPQLKKLAANIKAAQGPEISTMNAWLKQWGAPATAGGMDHGTDGMMTDADMSKLRRASGAEFDRMWLTMMIAHHQGAVTMAKNALASTANMQVKALAQSIVDGQDSEIAIMKGMLAGG